MRRSVFVIIALVALLSIVLVGSTRAEEKSDKLTTIPVSPVEDLMREHGVLRRILLIYDRELKDIEKNKNPQYEAIFKSATIIHDFIYITKNIC